MEKQGVEMIENKMLEETKNAKFKPNIVLQILIFFLAFGCSYLIQVFAIFAILLKLGLMYLQSDVLNNVMQGEEYLIFGLLLSVTYIAVAFVYCLCIEKRSLSSMGISKKRVISSYSIGIAIGAIMILAVIGIGYLFGVYQYVGIGTISITTLLLFVFAFMIQTMSEEILFRGYFMNSLTNRVGKWGAIFISAFIFACLHLPNAGMNIFYFISILLLGVFLGMYVLKTGNIWGASGIHFAWNFIQTTILGISNTTISIKSSFFQLQVVQSENTVINQLFGVEGGFDCLFVILIAVLILDVIIRKKNKKMKQVEKN